MTRAKQGKFVFRFTAAEACQLEAYIRARHEGADAGWFYGNRKQFDAREERIKDELTTTEHHRG